MIRDLDANNIWSTPARVQLESANIFYTLAQRCRDVERPIQ